MTSAPDIIQHITGMTPNLPCLIPFDAARSSGALVLAQAAQDISGVAPDFVKQFMVMLAYVLGLSALAGGGYLLGKKGTKGNPLNVDATVSETPTHAPQSAVDELRASMAAMARENLREHNAHRDAIAKLIESGSQREMNILGAIHDLKNTVTRETLDELKDIHERLNPLEAACAALKEAVDNLKVNVATLWQRVFKRA